MDGDPIRVGPDDGYGNYSEFDKIAARADRVDVAENGRMWINPDPCGEVVEIDSEIQAMARIWSELSRFDEVTRIRIVGWIHARTMGEVR